MDNHTPLKHLELNADKAETIVIIHGGFSDPLEWEHVVRHLLDYHIILPDLTSIARTSQDANKSNDASQSGASVPSAQSPIPHHASLVHDLILAYAHTPAHSSIPVVHLVGFSLGAHFALYIATRYPDVVASLLLSGCSRLAGPGASVKLGPWQRTLLPYGTKLEMGLEGALPRGMLDWMTDGGVQPARGQASVTSDSGGSRSGSGGSTIGNFDELRARPAPSKEMWRVRDFCATLLRDEDEDALPTRCRTVVVAATKRSTLLPTDDNLNVARSVARSSLGGDAAGSRRVRLIKVPSYRHPWMLQDPKLFAETIKMSVHGKEELPSDLLEELDLEG